MPGLNRKGPAGDGPMTGRKLGRCTRNSDVFPGGGYRRLGSGNRYGRGYGGGYGYRGTGGRGFGFRWGNPFSDYPANYHQNVSDETLLENEARLLREQLSNIEKELQRLQNKREEE
jgi:hypothetical protein